MTNTIIVYGPPGCGKTLHSAKIAKHFGVSSIIDDGPLPERLEPQTLYLIQRRPIRILGKGVRLFEFSKLMEKLG